jgi:hypothetical protein
VGEQVTLAVYENKLGYQAGSCIKDSNASTPADKFYKSFFEWNDDYKTNFQSLIYNELTSRGEATAPVQEVVEDISLDSIPF